MSDARSRAEAWLTHGRVWCRTCLEAADLINGLLAEPPARETGDAFHPSLVREVTEEAKTWLSAPYSNHGPHSIVDARGIMFRLLAVIHESSRPTPPATDEVTEAAEALRVERLKYRASPGLYISDDLRAARRRIGVLTDALLDALAARGRG